MASFKSALIKSAWVGFVGVASLVITDKVKAIDSQDIVIFPLQHQDNTVNLVLEPFYLTYRQGYDNQPKFSQDGQAIYFTRMLDKESGNGQQTDIYRYSFSDKSLSNVTQSPQHSEYSATPFPSFDSEPESSPDNMISIIGVNPKGEQHLRTVDLDSGKQQTLRADIEPVGYHAWLSADKAAVFVLGEAMTLQILDKGSAQPASVLASNIGRCFDTLSAGLVSFTEDVDGLHEVKTVDHEGHIETTGFTLPQGVQDYVWLNPETLIVGKGSTLLLVKKEHNQELADLSPLNIEGITRLALSPDGSKLAVVYQRP